MLAENSNLHWVNSNLREGERRRGNIFRGYMCNVCGEVSRQGSILLVFSATEGFNSFHLEDGQIVTMVVTHENGENASVIVLVIVFVLKTLLKVETFENDQLKTVTFRV